MPTFINLYRLLQWVNEDHDPFARQKRKAKACSGCSNCSRITTKCFDWEAFCELTPWAPECRIYEV